MPTLWGVDNPTVAKDASTLSWHLVDPMTRAVFRGVPWRLVFAPPLDMWTTPTAAFHARHSMPSSPFAEDLTLLDALDLCCAVQPLTQAEVQMLAERGFDTTGKRFIRTPRNSVWPALESPKKARKQTAVAAAATAAVSSHQPLGHTPRKLRF